MSKPIPQEEYNKKPLTRLLQWVRGEIDPYQEAMETRQQCAEKPTKPVPLTEQEIINMGLEKRTVKIDFNEGDKIRVKYGPLEGFVGVITAIIMDRQKIKAKVSMFGRDTDVELEFNQVEALV